jgi:uncharacterized coiled-coil protein SlyX
MEERIIELETRLAFQRQALQGLNQVLTDQQRQAGRLRSALDGMERLDGAVTMTLSS